MKKKSNEANFKEFSFEGANNMFEGRIYTDKPKNTEKCVIYPLSLTVNGLCLVGCKLWITNSKQWVAFPQYKSGDEYKNICFFVTEQDNKDVAELATKLKSIVNEEA